MPRRATPEQDFHTTAARYLTMALPEHAVWTTFPAGGGGKIRGALLKAMGLRPGWPDIQILVRESPYTSARAVSRFIGLECKTPVSQLRKNQKDCHALIRNAGGEVYVVRTLREIYECLHVQEGLRLKVNPQ